MSLYGRNIGILWVVLIVPCMMLAINIRYAKDYVILMVMEMIITSSTVEK